jgi:glycosyltransferase involved in cell wall biosynthesis
VTTSPAASVLLPVRDAAPWLEEALTSLSRQTFEDFEVVLVDDGSTDESPRIAREVAARDPRVRVSTVPARGLVPALRLARDRARAPLLVRMDADDVAHPERIGGLVRAADEHPDVDFFAHRIRYAAADGLGEGMRRYEAWINACLSHEAILRERFVECPMPHPAWAVRAETYDALGGYRDDDLPEDYDLFLRACDAGVRFLKLEAVLLDWREHPARASRVDARYGLDRFRALKRRHLRPYLQACAGPVVVAGEGRGARRWIRELLADDLPVAAWVTDRVDRSVAGVRTLSWEDLRGLGAGLALAVAGRAEHREALVARLAACGLHEPDRVLRLA